MNSSEIAGLASDPSHKLRFLHALIAVFLIVAAAVLAYSNTFEVPFIFDDGPAIATNKNIKHLWPLTTSMNGPEMTTVASRPFICLTIAINYYLSELRVWSYHAFNLIVHILASLALFGIVRRTLLRPKLRGEFGSAAGDIALISALIFAVHPLQTESVTYIIQRCESVMGLCFLATLYFSILGWDLPGWRIFWHVLAVTCCAAGMMSKEVMIVAPLLVLLYDYLLNGPAIPPMDRETKARSKPAEGSDIGPRSYVLYTGLAATWFILFDLMSTGKSQAASNIAINTLRTPPIVYLLSQGKIILQYLRLSFWPDPLCLDYNWPGAQSFWEVLPYCEVLGVMLYLSIRAVVKRRPWGFLGAWFFLILAPTSSVLPITDLAFEHRMYLPLAAVIVLVVTAIYRSIARLWFDSARRRAGVALASLSVAFLGIRTFTRNNDYRSEIVIWTTVLKLVPDNARAHTNLGAALHKEHKIDEALKEYRSAIRLDPHNVDALDNLGNVLSEKGQYEEALVFYRICIALRPTFVPVYSNLGITLGHMNRHDEAIEAFKKCLKLDPEFLSAQIGMGASLGAIKRYDEAVAHLNEALRLAPNHPDALTNLGLVASGRGNYQEAIEWLKKAISASGTIDAHTAMANAYQQLGDKAGALAELREVLRLSPDNVIAMDNVGQALMNLGRTDEAINEFESVLRAHPDAARTFNTLGCAWVDKKEYDQAIKQFKAALKIAPNLEEAKTNLRRALVARGEEYELSGKLTDAVAHWKMAIEFDANGAVFRHHLGRLLVALGKPAEAVPHFEEEIRTTTQNAAGANFDLGCVLAQLGKDAGALSHFKEAMRLEPGNVELKCNIALAMDRMGATDESLAVYKDALNRDPKNIRVYIGMGNCLAADGKKREAIAAYRDALKIDPRNGDVHNCLGAVLAQIQQYQEAADHFTDALKVNPNDTMAKENLDRAMKHIQEPAKP